MAKLYYVFSIDYQLISHRRKLVETAVKLGYDVTVVAHDTGYKQKILDMGCKFVDLPINRVGTNVLEEMKTLRFLYNLYKKDKPDIVHHISVKVVLWGGLAARLAKVRGIVNAVNGLGVFFESGKVDSLIKRIFMRIIHFSNNRHNTVTIFQNDSDKAFFVDYGAIKESQCRYIKGSGVDLVEFPFTPMPESIPLKIIFTSRMVKEKGVMDIIEAAKILRQEYKGKIQFLLCGLLETNPKAVNKEYLYKECDGTYVKYMGHCDNIKQLLQESSIVLLPSYYREGVPKSLIEATAIGRPIITCDSIGCRETVDDGKNGFLIPVKKPKALAEKLTILINDKGMRKKMGEISRKKAETEFSVDIVIDKHLQIYNSLLKYGLTQINPE